MDTGTILLVATAVLFIAYLVDKNVKMMKYRKLYDQALRERDGKRALEYGRLYHRYRTGPSSKQTSAAEMVIQNDIKAAGIE
jgi:hypothetical protein